MIPSAIVRAAEEHLRAHISGFQSPAGGCINSCAIIETATGPYFVKWNRADLYPGMFEVEFCGLNLLRSTQTVSVPEPLFTGSGEGWSWIMMEAVLPGAMQKDAWERFGQSLAALHRNRSGQFGLAHNNYVGSLPQHNDLRETWSEFYIDMRLEPQLRLATGHGLLDETDVRHFQKLFARLGAIFPSEAPSLLHGDLWSGNFLMGPEGYAWVMDPAVYYGHREMDLAMTRLFGGFHQRFYDAYNEAHPLASGWEERVELAQLYPLLVHVNLFGGGYAGSVRDIIARF